MIAWGFILFLGGIGIGFLGKVILKSYSVEHFGDMMGGIGILMMFVGAIF